MIPERNKEKASHVHVCNGCDFERFFSNSAGAIHEKSLGGRGDGDFPNKDCAGDTEIQTYDEWEGGD